MQRLRSVSTDSGASEIRLGWRTLNEVKKVPLLAIVLSIVLVVCGAALIVVILMRLKQVQDNLLLHHNEISSLRKSISTLKMKYGHPKFSAQVSQISNRGKHEATNSQIQKTSVAPLLRSDQRQMSSDLAKMGALKREMIHLVGVGRSHSPLHAGDPVHQWKVHVRRGSISLHEGSHIRIKVPGLYFIYSQVQFLWPPSEKEKLKSVVYNVIRNRSESVLRSVVPVSNCLTTCTRYHARLAQLNANDMLSVQAMQKVIIVTREEVTYFGAFLISAL